MTSRDAKTTLIFGTKLNSCRSKMLIVCKNRGTWSYTYSVRPTRSCAPAERIDSRSRTEAAARAVKVHHFGNRKATAANERVYGIHHSSSSSAFAPLIRALRADPPEIPQSKPRAAISAQLNSPPISPLSSRSIPVADRWPPRSYARTTSSCRCRRRTGSGRHRRRRRTGDRLPVTPRGAPPPGGPHRPAGDTTAGRRRRRGPRRRWRCTPGRPSRRPPSRAPCRCRSSLSRRPPRPSTTLRRATLGVSCGWSSSIDCLSSATCGSIGGFWLLLLVPSVNCS